jgi:hypothetical protein
MGFLKGGGFHGGCFVVEREKLGIRDIDIPKIQNESYC